jgi:hypothetical protein
LSINEQSLEVLPGMILLMSPLPPRIGSERDQNAGDNDRQLGEEPAPWN